tara:strand:+ start:128 stop:1000 length:873 start_codon:yes stop_codon:yes gene_type:complete
MKKISQSINKKPNWLKTKINVGSNYKELKTMVKNKNLNTVCEEALCPNIYECWERRSATLMILGDVCTRSCGFCSVITGKPIWDDPEEPLRTAQAVKQMGLKHCVITSVNRDELVDGGAKIWSETVKLTHKLNPKCSVEVLIPDMKNKDDSLDIIFKSQPEILGHNMETVPRLYKSVRPQARYDWSLSVLQKSKKFGLRTKTAFMLGLGETAEEVFELINDIYKTGCDILAIGQYLQPTKKHLPVQRYVDPEEFKIYKNYGLELGLKWVEAGPLVRSSYHADEQAKMSIS